MWGGLLRAVVLTCTWPTLVGTTCAAALPHTTRSTLAVAPAVAEPSPQHLAAAAAAPAGGTPAAAAAPACNGHTWLAPQVDPSCTLHLHLCTLLHLPALPAMMTVLAWVCNRCLLLCFALEIHHRAANLCGTL